MAFLDFVGAIAPVLQGGVDLEILCVVDGETPDVVAHFEREAIEDVEFGRYYTVGCRIPKQP